MIKDLLLNVLTILFSIFAVQVVLLRWPNVRMMRRYQIAIGLFGGLSAILCLTFPVRFDEGVLWDFRWIPLTAAILYGGYRAGLISVVLYFPYRLLLGGPAAYFALTGSLIMVLLCFVMAGSFYKRARGQRYIVALGLSLLAYIHLVANTLFFLSYVNKMHAFEEYAEMFALAGFLQLVLTLLSVFLIETALEMAKIKYEIQRTEQLVTVSELAASVAHEVRNPLTVVRGFLQMAKSSMDMKVRTYMDTAITELDRAEFIISDYLSLAKPQADRLETMDVEEKLGSISALMSSFAAMHNVELRTNLTADLFVRVDAMKLGQVIINLVKNAVEASSGKGHGRVYLNSFVKRGNVAIEVEDDGEGMTQQQLSQLGSSYFTTKENGTGLGIMVAFRILQAMNGKLEYESVKGQGTIARITLPQAAPKSE